MEVYNGRDLQRSAVEDPGEDGKVMLEYSGNIWYCVLTDVDVSRYTVLELSDTEWRFKTSLQARMLLSSVCRGSVMVWALNQGDLRRASLGT